MLAKKYKWLNSNPKNQFPAQHPTKPTGQNGEFTQSEYIKAVAATNAKQSCFYKPKGKCESGCGTSVDTHFIGSKKNLKSTHTKRQGHMSYEEYMRLKTRPSLRQCGRCYYTTETGHPFDEKTACPPGTCATCDGHYDAKAGIAIEECDFVDPIATIYAPGNEVVLLDLYGEGILEAENLTNKGAPGTDPLELIVHIDKPGLTLERRHIDTINADVIDILKINENETKITFNAQEIGMVKIRIVDLIDQVGNLIARNAFSLHIDNNLPLINLDFTTSSSYHEKVIDVGSFATDTADSMAVTVTLSKKLSGDVQLFLSKDGSQAALIDPTSMTSIVPSGTDGNLPDILQGIRFEFRDIDALKETMDPEEEHRVEMYLVRKSPEGSNIPGATLSDNHGNIVPIGTKYGITVLTLDNRAIRITGSSVSGTRGGVPIESIDGKLYLSVGDMLKIDAVTDERSMQGNIRTLDDSTQVIPLSIALSFDNGTLIEDTTMQFVGSESENHYTKSFAVTEHFHEKQIQFVVSDARDHWRRQSDSVQGNTANQIVFDTVPPNVVGQSSLTNPENQVAIESAATVLILEAELVQQESSIQSAMRDQLDNDVNLIESRIQALNSRIDTYTESLNGSGLTDQERAEATEQLDQANAELIDRNAEQDSVLALLESLDGNSGNALDLQSLIDYKTASRIDSSDDLEGTAGTAAAAILDFERAQTELEAKELQLGTTATNLRTEINSLNADIQSLKQSREESQTDHEADLSLLDSVVAEVNSRTEEISQQLENKVPRSEIETNLSDEEANITNKEEEKSNKNTEIEGLSSQIQAAESAIASKRTERDSARNAHEADLAARNDSISDLEQTVFEKNVAFQEAEDEVETKQIAADAAQTHFVANPDDEDAANANTAAQAELNQAQIRLNSAETDRDSEAQALQQAVLERDTAVNQWTTKDGESESELQALELELEQKKTSRQVLSAQVAQLEQDITSSSELVSTYQADLDLYKLKDNLDVLMSQLQSRRETTINDHTVADTSLSLQVSSKESERDSLLVKENELIYLEGEKAAAERAKEQAKAGAAAVGDQLDDFRRIGAEIDALQALQDSLDKTKSDLSEERQYADAAVAFGKPLDNVHLSFQTNEKTRLKSIITIDGEGGEIEYPFSPPYVWKDQYSISIALDENTGEGVLGVKAMIEDRAGNEALVGLDFGSEAFTVFRKKGEFTVKSVETNSRLPASEGEQEVVEGDTITITLHNDQLANLDRFSGRYTNLLWKEAELVPGQTIYVKDANPLPGSKARVRDSVSGSWQEGWVVYKVTPISGQDSAWTVSFIPNEGSSDHIVKEEDQKEWADWEIQDLALRDLQSSTLAPPDEGMSGNTLSADLTITTMTVTDTEIDVEMNGLLRDIAGNEYTIVEDQ
jgi:hypothetical protein